MGGVEVRAFQMASEVLHPSKCRCRGVEVGGRLPERNDGQMKTRRATDNNDNFDNFDSSSEDSQPMLVYCSWYILGMNERPITCS